jgi:undecaprenyl-diphosphatase
MLKCGIYIYQTQEAMFIFLLLIQILAESLPVSSSGHVMLARILLQRQGYEVNVSQSMLWLVHGITALLMLMIMTKYWSPLLRHPWRMRWILWRMTWYGLCAECLATLVYLSLQGTISEIYLVPGFLITMLALFSLQFVRRTNRQPPFFVWIMTGIAQGIAVIPGCSRLALTYTIARWLGYSGRHALFLSFTFALPPFIIASLYGAYEMFHSLPGLYNVSYYDIMGIIIVSYAAYKVLVLTSYLMMTDRAYYFAWYMIFVSIFALAL